MAFRDADVVVTLLTEQLGKIAALARSARAARRRSPCVLEPMHTLAVEVRNGRQRDLATVSSAVVVVARTRLVADLSRMQAAGRLLRWLRAALPMHLAEPPLWHVVQQALDSLDAAVLAGPPEVLMVEAGLRILDVLGWGLELQACVACGRACEPTRAACVNVQRGGLVCRACGGAEQVLSGMVRQRMLAAVGESGSLQLADVPEALAVLEAAFLVHADVRG